MNISLPDILWTIICFLLFAFMLNGLLIKPVLKLMDERKEKVARAHARMEELEKARKEAEERALAEAEEAARRMAEREALAASEAEKAAKARIGELESELRIREEATLERIREESVQTDARISSALDGMVEAFTEKLMKGGES